MFRHLANIPPNLTLLTLLLVPLLRIPSFMGWYVLEDEALLKLIGDRLGDGAILYRDIWYAGPPVMPWLYGLFSFAFGKFALTALRIFTTLYIIHTALYFTGLLATQTSFRKYIGLVTLLFIVLVSVPWYAQEMSASLFVLLPMSIAFHALLRLTGSRGHNNRMMFRVGMLMTLSILATYQAVFILAGFLIAYLLISTSKTEELFSFFMGTLLMLLPIAFILYYTSSILEFWELGVLYYLDNGLHPKGYFHFANVWHVLKAWFSSWGVIIALAAGGFLQFRLSFLRQVASVRLMERVMSIWFVVSLLMLAIKTDHLQLSDFVLAIPPVTFYAAWFLDLPRLKRLRWLLLVLALISPTAIYVGFWQYSSAWPDRVSSYSPAYSLLRGEFPAIHQRAQDLQRAPALQSGSGSLYIMDYRPQDYVLLGMACPVKYLDFRIAKLRLSALADSSERELISGWESEDLFYHEFSARMPDLIVDTRDNFPYLQRRYPLLFHDFEAEDFGSFILYQRNTGAQ